MTPLPRCARLLLVDDNEVNRTVGTLLLERLGMQVLLAADGAQALSMLEADDTIDAVLMDCQMPVLDGWTATRRIREQPRWARLPVIAVTAGVLPEDRQACLAAGMDDCIAKPVEVEAMRAALARWLPPRRAEPR